MAFGVEELRVLRRALALALNPDPASAEDVQDCLRLAESLDEAMREGARLRAFLVSDLGRYRAALPGTAAGYLALLEEALGAGYRPEPDDLAGLRALRGNPVAAALLERCQVMAEQDVRARLARRTGLGAATVTPVVPACRTRLHALPGGLSEGSARGAEGDPEQEPAKKPATPPAEKPGTGPEPASPAEPQQPRRPIPTPGEVFPRRKPTPPPAQPPQQLAAG
ncbi:hypothetical protein GA0115233_10791 [Streptomyces sp. DI166]|uniref:hypothetical protein n=1 Tax=unclassified Streptomyces TaxID=2593676 RepID=UPI0007F4AA51|nr:MULTISPECIES: hypothetical protein [unclassified Streptomyces]SBT94094.1 hypothetical protein GA0115233_10791 [Streptomyces sp. DI166]